MLHSHVPMYIFGNVPVYMIVAQFSAGRDGLSATCNFRLIYDFTPFNCQVWFFLRSI